MENFQDRGVLIQIRFVLRGWIRIRSISDRIRNPAHDTFTSYLSKYFLLKTILPSAHHIYKVRWRHNNQEKISTTNPSTIYSPSSGAPSNPMIKSQQNKLHTHTQSQGYSEFKDFTATGKKKIKTKKSEKNSVKQN